MESNRRVAAGPRAERRGASPVALLRCASWLVLSALLVACTPASVVKPAPEPPTEEDEGWKAITG